MTRRGQSVPYFPFIGPLLDYSWEELEWGPWTVSGPTGGLKSAGLLSVSQAGVTSPWSLGWWCWWQDRGQMGLELSSQGNGTICGSVARTLVREPHIWVWACLVSWPTLVSGSPGLLPLPTWTPKLTWKHFCLWMATQLLLLCGGGAGGDLLLFCWCHPWYSLTFEIKLIHFWEQLLR